MKIDMGTEGATLATIGASLLFCTGVGQSETRALEITDRQTSEKRRNPHPTAGAEYAGISGKDIVSMIRKPPSVPKEAGRWFIPSTYRGCDARAHVIQATQGEFWFLPLDVDGNNLSLDEVDEALVAACGDVQRMIYSTRSSTPENRKWRALLPLQAPLPGQDYSDTVEAFNTLLEDASGGTLIADPKLRGTGQLVYLPNRGAFYEQRITRADRLDLQQAHPIVVLRDKTRTERARADARAKEARARKAAQAPREGDSTVQAFNAACSVADTLERYGYARAGHSRDYRSPMQTSGSYATRDMGDYWVSLSASDDAAGIGVSTTNGARFGDAFDLYCHFEHGGNFREAVKAYSESIGTGYRTQRANDRGLSGSVTLDFRKRGGNDMVPFEQASALHLPPLPTYVPPAPPEPRRSRFLKVSDLQGKPIPQREWLVQDLVPSQTVTLFSGDGGTGKSLLTLQLAAAVSIPGGHWLGRSVTQGKALVISAEDDEDELHRRWADIADANGVPLSALANLEYRSLAGEDALLALMTGVGAALVPSALYHEVDAYMTQHRPSLLVLDTCADLYPANENDRAQVRQFVGLLRGLALRHRCAVILLSHPSLSGMSSGTGSSGSTAWNNSVRSRLYLERVTEDGYEPDTKARKLSNKKSNYGPTGLEITMTWRDGVFHADAPLTTLDRSTVSMKAERVFLKLLKLHTEQDRPVNGKAGLQYAPAVFCKSKEGEGLSKAAFRGAMDSLFHAGKIRNVETGPPSRRTTYLALTGD